jgi:hypothetical protein
MICADAYSPNTPHKLGRQGASVLASPAVWTSGPHGPNGEWERSTVDTGLPLFVCNRSGRGRRPFARRKRCGIRRVPGLRIIASLRRVYLHSEAALGDPCD